MSMKPMDEMPMEKMPKAMPCGPDACKAAMNDEQERNDACCDDVRKGLRKAPVKP